MKSKAIIKHQNVAVSRQKVKLIGRCVARKIKGRDVCCFPLTYCTPLFLGSHFCGKRGVFRLLRGLDRISGTFIDEYQLMSSLLVCSRADSPQPADQSAPFTCLRSQSVKISLPWTLKSLNTFRIGATSEHDQS